MMRKAKRKTAKSTRTEPEAHDAGQRWLDRAVARERHDGRRDDVGGADDGEHSEPSQARAQEVRPAHARHGPHLVERVLDGEGHAEARPDRKRGANRQRDPAALQRGDVATELVADDRNLRDGRVEHVLLELRVVLEDEAEDRDERQQQREQREERPVGDERGEARRLVLLELLEHRDRER
jgi:hypothetical protein